MLNARALVVQLELAPSACIRRALELGHPRWWVAAEPDIEALQRSPAYRAMMRED